MKWLWRLSFMLTLLLFLRTAYLLVACTYSYSDEPVIFRILPSVDGSESPTPLF